MPKGGCHGLQEWVDGEPSDRCPVMYTNDYSLVFDAYLGIENHCYPESGGLFDQPAKLMGFVSIVQGVNAGNMKRRSKQNGAR